MRVSPSKPTPLKNPLSRRDVDGDDPLGARRPAVDRLAYDLLRQCERSDLERSASLALALEAVLAQALRSFCSEEERASAATFLLAETLAAIAGDDADLAVALAEQAFGDVAELLVDALAARRAGADPPS